MLNAERPARVPKPFLKQGTEARLLKLPVINRPPILEQAHPIIVILEPVQPLLKIVGMTAAAYLHHLETICQLAPPPEFKLLAMPLFHLLAAPPELKLLPALTQSNAERLTPILLEARSTFPSDEIAQAAFEQFLVDKRIYDKARYQGWSRTALLDGDDIAQMVVIHLWENWWKGREPIRGSNLKFAIREVCGSNKWNWRVVHGKAPHIGAIEAAASTSTLLGDEVEETGQEHLDFLLNSKARGENIRGMNGVDTRIDIEDAITTVTLYMMFIESLKKGRHRTPPHIVPERLDAFFKGYMYFRNGGTNGHIGGRHNSHLLGYWLSRGLHKSTGLKWRDRVFPIMAGLLAEYEPLSQPR